MRTRVSKFVSARKSVFCISLGAFDGFYCKLRFWCQKSTTKLIFNFYIFDSVVISDLWFSRSLQLFFVASAALCKCILDSHIENYYEPTPTRHKATTFSEKYSSTYLIKEINKYEEENYSAKMVANALQARGFAVSACRIYHCWTLDNKFSMTKKLIEGSTCDKNIAVYDSPKSICYKMKNDNTNLKFRNTRV